MNEAALAFLDDFIEHGPAYPPEPPDCEMMNRQRCNDHLVCVVVTMFQVMRSAIRIAGHDHDVGNPGDIMEIWKKYHRKLDEYLVANSGTGGAP